MNSKLIDGFIAQLQARPHSDRVFNPYRDPLLANNLRTYLHAMTAVMGPKPALLVGEALGYKGGRLTGIPFSSGELLLTGRHRFLRQLAPKLTIVERDAEVSASLVWQTLERRRHLPLFWNAFPFHPHRSNLPGSNRAPSADEVKEGGEYLQALMAIYRPCRVAAIGRAAERALVALQSEGQEGDQERRVRYIRHPSYGGKADFVAGMARFLKT
ncbi:uracil-DNA glycosylase [Aestuariirhabdus sp. Z084]|uniref:uracil-DNA glycosylase n=1 Tax=Aestuariirhabdus haliotis TaxID=2918751 RepID=UPI00201B4546|nr:uracil-DNA glycosylase [Aestuariirhabdus haliotis]MCL6416246.1 uracil-DNA glycosylase [Aestuariirhabdus haliotis]MCL6420294.1 uracil-DNA glycosylase [Aestuariirhabdus haliotis]